MYYDGADDYYWSYEDGYDEESADYDAASAWAAGPPRRSIVQCSNGPSCKFLALGVCRFYHPEAEEEGAAGGSAAGGAAGAAATSAEEAQASGWEETGDDWQAWEEQSEQPQEPKVFRMVPTKSASVAPPPAAARAPAAVASAAAEKSPVASAPAAASAPLLSQKPAASKPAAPAGPRWNVLVNSQPTPAKAARDSAPVSAASHAPAAVPLAARAPLDAARAAPAAPAPGAAAALAALGSDRRSRRASATTPGASRSPRRRHSAALTPSREAVAREVSVAVPAEAPRKTVVRLREAPGFATGGLQQTMPPPATHLGGFVRQAMVEPLEPPPGIF